MGDRNHDFKFEICHQIRILGSHFQSFKNKDHSFTLMYYTGAFYWLLRAPHLEPLWVFK